ncbi:MAG: tyrosine-type recombinase/integrase [Streptosporangiales bacterium]
MTGAWVCRRSAYPFHDLRHSCATLLYKQGVPLENIQDVLGQSCPTVTKTIYVDVTKKVQRNAVERLGYLFADDGPAAVLPCCTATDGLPPGAEYGRRAAARRHGGPSRPRALKTYRKFAQGRGNGRCLPSGDARQWWARPLWASRLRGALRLR